jgi:hypothetical protein
VIAIQHEARSHWLTRDAVGILTATPVVRPANMKAKTYRSQLRRVIAEAMLGQGAIVGEGMSEQLAHYDGGKKDVVGGNQQKN